MNNDITVLVTGASGFVGMHCILQLLEKGYRVKGTVRSLAKADHLRQILQQHSQHTDRLELVEADLMQDAGWAEAVSGCHYVLHVASPFPSSTPKNEDDLIIPAREGTLRVLRAAHQAGVQRLVLTSSVAAISAGHESGNKTYDESDWSNLNGPIEAYPKSKTLAEKAAWDYVNQPDVEMELVAINPSLILGPVLDARQTSTSAEVILKLLKREYPGMPRLNWGIVDVRDVAAAHVAAMTSPEAAGKRFVCSSGSLWLVEIAKILNQHFASQGYKVPTWQLPDFAVRLAALFDPTIKLVVGGLGQETRLSNQQLKSILDLPQYSPEDAVVAMGQSVIDLKVV
ncbi:MAG: aldehyde reductase [Ardenticatenaceae bacterium]|nr:aldehyde reductase [Ardenticatenaceae bacterium]